MLHNFRYYEREPVTIGPEVTVTEIADTMEEHAVGCVIVVDADQRPVGIVTDRDLVRRVVAAGRDAEKTRARDVMTSELVTVTRDELLPGVIEKLRTHKIRRLPVVDKGRVVSVVALDDFVFHLSSAFLNLSETTRIEVAEAERAARRRRKREAREQALEEIRCHCAAMGHDVAARLKEDLARVFGRSSAG